MKTSIIYKNIFLYRFVMNILYSCNYSKRFSDIISRIDSSCNSVLDLCFGDVYIANFCRKNSINWTGYDINSYFVKNARKQGYNAFQKDLSELNTFPKSDICILLGSLYHFNNEIEPLFQKMLTCAPKIIISEPIVNLSSHKGIIGKMARFFTNAGKGNEEFRFTKDTIIQLLEKLQMQYNFSFTIISIKRDILIEITHEGN